MQNILPIRAVVMILTCIREVRGSKPDPGPTITFPPVLKTIHLQLATVTLRHILPVSSSPCMAFASA